MDVLQVIKRLISEDERPDIEKMRDFYAIASEGLSEDKSNIGELKWLSHEIAQNIRHRRGNAAQQYYLHYDILHTLAPIDFESYL